ncbi:MAG: 2-oxoglutarate oxidoreductase [Candidatus Omnitrophica bacterium]|nr:2-oxoglutarate oxidoreductase [Candidatus Omnitrophota bacterium]MBU1047198.1 2-oxoglutarate oxidoreductase [Candidatus Omnitrophota bacterium]MBU1766789.1 2-oxoglutarate oxidoreductase [Candidatus Omnitrophota bacterium]MBU1889498.1 2-oxoglutarate oxidoreductase [Candidatus Omnitrophota bacterium]
MEKKFGLPKTMKDVVTHYCPGCGHGVIHRIVAEVIDELNIREITIGIAPVGCAVLAYDYLNIDMAEAPHGRTPAVATGIKRVQPNKIVFTYQGDGDLAAIGTGEIVHTAARGENITTIFVNNAVYGMTGGQMAPTTLIKQKTQTTPFGRDPKSAGFPLRVPEMLKSIEGAVYLARETVISPKNIIRLKKYIKKAFVLQMEKAGFSLVEVLSPCPTNLRLSSIKSYDWVRENMLLYYPLGEIKDDS